MICPRRNGLERHKLLKRLNQLILGNVSIAIASGITSCDVPNRNRVIVGSCDVELLSIVGGECRCQDSALVSLPAIDTMILLAEGSR